MVARGDRRGGGDGVGARLDTSVFIATESGRPIGTLPVMEATMSRFARIVHDCRGAGVRPTVLDAMIAATAVQHGLPVFTQEAGFDVIASAHSELDVRRV